MSVLQQMRMVCFVHCVSDAGPVADALNLNAGVALAAAKIANSVQDGVALAKEVQESGKAAETLRTWRAVSQREKQREASAASHTQEARPHAVAK